MIKLTQRLAAIARQVTPGRSVADIGTDHAYLPIYLVELGVCPQAVAADVATGPYLNAREQVRLRRLANRISVRQGDGLAVLTPGEADILVVAGMGGRAIAEILESGLEVTTLAARLVLQPMEDADHLRHWLVNHGWRLVDEDLVMEGDRYYVILAAEPGQGACFGELELTIGPMLLAGRHPLLYGYLERRVQDIKRIIRQLAASDRDESRAKRRMMEQQEQQLEEVMAWLSSAGE